MFPELYTERLLLRRILPSDAPTVLKGYSDPAVYQFMSVQYHNPTDVQTQMDWYETMLTAETGIWWGICKKDTGEMIGNGGFHNWEKKHRCAELGYWILPPFHRRGYASEAIQAMVNQAFRNMNIHRVEAIVEAENKASSDLLIKNGFRLEGTRRECEWVKDKFIDLQIFAKLEFEK
ncbi:MAG: GNAT family N-acetyltransferase [Saprospiraceae bacterium]|nr:GNAT family N-acetyltransferase [Saprospiraceae bacterium]